MKIGPEHVGKKFKYGGSVAPTFCVLAVHDGWAFAYRVCESTKPEILPAYADWELVEEPKPDRAIRRVSEILGCDVSAISRDAWAVCAYLDELHSRGKLQ